MTPENAADATQAHTGSDDRIPVLFCPPRSGGPSPGAALVVDALALAPARDPLVERMRQRVGGHGVVCVCCAPRAALAEALHRLFVKRATGKVAWFDRVEVRTAAEAEAREALGDGLVAGRFRVA